MTPGDVVTMVKLTYSVDAYLRTRGLEVVETKWEGQQGEADGYLVLTCRRVVAPPLNPCGFCEHAQAVHETDGGCLAIDCACEVYTPQLEA